MRLHIEALEIDPQCVIHKRVEEGFSQDPRWKPQPSERDWQETETTQYITNATSYEC